MALRRAIRSLKKAGPGLLRRPSARSSGLSHTGLGAAATLIGRAIKTDTNAKRRTEHGLGILFSSRAVTQFVQRHIRAATQRARHCQPRAPDVKNVLALSCR